MMAAFPPSRGPDAGPGGETVGEGRLSSGDGNSAAGPAIMVPPEAGPRTKADRDGRPLAPLLLNGRVKGRPLPVTVSRKAGRHFRTSKPVQNRPPARISHGSGYTAFLIRSPGMPADV